MKLYVVDYRIPRSEEVDFFIVDADDDDMAERKAISKLKSLQIPKRYLIRIEEVL